MNRNCDKLLPDGSCKPYDIECIEKDGKWNCPEHTPKDEPAFGTFTLRDFFAGCALIGLCARSDYFDVADEPRIAEYLYKIADAMMKEREK